MQTLKPKETTEEGVIRRVKQLMLEHPKLAPSVGGAPAIDPESINIEVREVFAKPYTTQIHFNPAKVTPKSVQNSAGEAFHDTCNQIIGAARTLDSNSLKPDDAPQTHIYLDQASNHFKTNMYTDDLVIIARALNKMTSRNAAINLPRATPSIRDTGEAAKG